MKKLINFITTYPLIILSYAFYSFLWFILARATYRIKSIPADAPAMAKLSAGEGLVFAFFFIEALTIIYLLIVLGYAMLPGKDRKVYLTLLGFILIPAVIITIWGYS